MSDIAIVVVVTPISTGFDWVYHVYGTGFEATPGSQTLVIPKESSREIMVTLVSGGQPGDTCVFAEPPLTFTDEQGHPIDPPAWFQGLQSLAPFIILFTDDNTNLHTRDYFVKVNASYNGGATITSPDPTIVNAGTDGNVSVEDTAKGLTASRSPVEPAAVAV
ncbi:MAG: hypothetical protein ACJ76Y_12755 [Thermoanaerobaculia bacterium]